MCLRDYMMSMQRGKSYTHRGGGLLANAYQAGLKNRNVINHENLFPGEMHTILKVDGGGHKVANYMGPGTQVKKRLLR